MANVTPNESSEPGVAGIPPGLIAPLISVLEASSGPIRRRHLLEALERRGHRISLAGLNRILQHCSYAGLTAEGPDGIRLRR